MNQARIAIIGGGISGLYAAYLLQSQGISDYVLLEARERLGGRALSVGLVSTGTAPPDQTNRFDLGPSWFWPDSQPQLDRLVTELCLERFAQPVQGDMLIERIPGVKPARTKGYFSSPASVRLLGGMTALVDALAFRVNPDNLRIGRTVRLIHTSEQHLHVECEHADGIRESWTVEQVLLAAPPRLLAQDVEFLPRLPPSVAQRWRNTSTWMAPHAKYIAVFESAFWSQSGLSGHARSALGPLVEIHDASSPGGHAALFGFIGIPAHTRKVVPDKQLKELCRAQLVRVFGPKAGEPMAEFLKDWAQDHLTAVAQDLLDAGEPSISVEATVDSFPWMGRLIGIGSEWSPQFPGYIEGAIEAAALGVRLMLEKKRLPPSTIRPSI
ncbi:flavin monoamine oxidase family protein [Pseudomonas sp. PGPR40]|uniref:flavin monoamine oxidase family protein n=1 Tax=Pseudomonas sp. PGPR40 TaxID=2913476 RepID=UPI001EDAA9AF|nr:FAD-dependent oxidoreductase [Pseudomonas sp. PGPR40]